MSTAEFLQKAYQLADQRRKETAKAIATGVSFLGDKLESGVKQTASGMSWVAEKTEKTLDGVVYLGTQTINGVVYVTEKTVDGVEYLGTQTINGVVYVTEKTVDGVAYIGTLTANGVVWSIKKIHAVETLATTAVVAGVVVPTFYATSKVKEAYKDVKSVFSPIQDVTVPCRECIWTDTPARRVNRIKKRQHLLSASREHASKLPITSNERIAIDSACKRLDTNMQAVELARLSESAYDRDYTPQSTMPQSQSLENAPPSPWKAMSDDELVRNGIDVVAMKAAKATLYTAPDDWPLNPKTTLAFRGTTSEAEDLFADHDQALGLGAKNTQYENAKNVGIDVAKAFPEAMVTGHSLGGGKAQMAGTAGNLKGMMFNSAGLHPDSIPGRGIPSSSFKQFRSPGDPLTGLQNSAVYQAVAFKGAKVLNANAEAMRELGIDPEKTPWLKEQIRKLNENPATLGVYDDVKDRILNVTAQEAKANKAKYGWYVPPAAGEIIEIPSKTAEGQDSPLAAQHSIINIVNGMESQKMEDINQLIAKTRSTENAKDLVGETKVVKSM